MSSVRFPFNSLFEIKAFLGEESHALDALLDLEGPFEAPIIHPISQEEVVTTVEMEYMEPHLPVGHLLFWDREVVVARVDLVVQKNAEIEDISYAFYRWASDQHEVDSKVSLIKAALQFLALQDRVRTVRCNYFPNSFLLGLHSIGFVPNLTSGIRGMSSLLRLVKDPHLNPRVARFNSLVLPPRWMGRTRNFLECGLSGSYRFRDSFPLIPPPVEKFVPQQVATAAIPWVGDRGWVVAHEKQVDLFMEEGYTITIFNLAERANVFLLQSPLLLQLVPICLEYLNGTTVIECNFRTLEGKWQDIQGLYRLRDVLSSTFVFVGRLSIWGTKEKAESWEKAAKTAFHVINTKKQTHPAWGTLSLFKDYFSLQEK